MANIIEVVDDGLPCPEVGRWAVDKYRLVGMYSSMFSRGMKHKWDERIYVELYSGAGYSRVRGTSKVLAASPVLALTAPDLFTKYVFCEEDRILLDALEQRARRHAPKANCSFILGDCNERVDEILKSIPSGSPSRRVLSLCFVDPFDIGIKFSTLKTLADRFVDFLVLLAVYMDANRNYERYLADDSQKLDQFLGDREWRHAWAGLRDQRKLFPRFLAEQFSSRMERLGYLKQPVYKMKKVRTDEKNLPLYYLALFSRSKKAHEFWDEVLKYSTDQRRLF